MRGALLALLVAACAPGLARAQGFEDLERAARQSPASSAAWDSYGEALAREQRFAEAHDAFARALKLSPNSKVVLHHTALAYAWAGDYKEAARRFADLVGRFSQDVPIRLDYGQTLAWDKRFDEARAQYRLILAENPRHVEAMRLLAQLTAWQGGYDEALELLGRALDQDPQNTNVLVNQGEILSWKGEPARAAAAFRRALDIAPKNASVWTNLAQVYASQGRNRDAQDAYRASLALEPRGVDAALGLAQAYRDNHQYDEAGIRLRDALALNPSEPRLRKALAALAADRTLQLSNLIEWTPPLLFVVILLLIHRHVWRYRRLLRHRYAWVTRLLLASLPVLAALTAVVYGFVLFPGSYYKEAEYASRLLQLLNLLILFAVFFSLVWILRFARPLREHVVLAVGAHPDDIEFGCGATLLRYREEGCRTYGLVLSAGESGNAAGSASERIQEARRSARVLALTELSVLDFPDTRLHLRKEEIRRAIEDRIRELRPDIIFTHSAIDVHTDHKTASEATREAARGACTLLAYENPNTPPEFNPNYYVDIDGYLEDKIAALSLHRTQSGKDYTDPKVVRASAAFRGNQARIKSAEAFEAVRVLEEAAGQA